MTGEKSEDVLNALQDFISLKLPLICECKLTPAEIVAILHQLAWTYHQEWDRVISKQL